MKKLLAVLMIGALLALPLSAMAMDAVTNAELDGVAGQAGVTIAFGGAATTTISFSALSWGDPDGAAGTCGSNAGWLIIQGSSAIEIDQIIDCGEMLTLDIGTTGANTCDVAPGACVVNVPDGTTFIAVGLPDVTMDITVPETMTVGLGTAANTISGTLGLLNLAGLSVSAGTPTALYVWAH